jgi:hypothetical protein
VEVGGEESNTVPDDDVSDTASEGSAAGGEVELTAEETAKLEESRAAATEAVQKMTEERNNVRIVDGEYQVQVRAGAAAWCVCARVSVGVGAPGKCLFVGCRAQCC